MLDGLDAEGGGDVGLAGARPADEHDIVGARHELASMQLANQGFGNLAGGEVEAGQILVGREPGGLDLVGDRADLAFGKLGLQQLRQDGDSRVKGRCGRRDKAP